MKMLRRNISLILVVLAALFFMWGFASSLRHRKKEEEIKLSTITISAEKVRPFVVMIPDKKGKFSDRELESVRNQEYPSYRTVVYREEELPSAIHKCRDEEILLFLGREGWLAHEEVLSWLNLCYEDPHVWMTLGNHVEYPSYRKGSSKKGLLSCPIRSGYAGIFKQVKEEDLHGESLVVAATQMAEQHVRHVSDVLYVYDRQAEKLVGKGEWEELHSTISYSPIVSWRGE